MPHKKRRRQSPDYLKQVEGEWRPHPGARPPAPPTPHAAYAEYHHLPAHVEAGMSEWTHLQDVQNALSMITRRLADSLCCDYDCGPSHYANFDADYRYAFGTPPTEYAPRRFGGNMRFGLLGKAADWITGALFNPSTGTGPQVKPGAAPHKTFEYTPGLMPPSPLAQISGKGARMPTRPPGAPRLRITPKVVGQPQQGGEEGTQAQQRAGKGWELVEPDDTSAAHQNTADFHPVGFGRYSNYGPHYPTAEPWDLPEILDDYQPDRSPYHGDRQMTPYFWGAVARAAPAVARGVAKWGPTAAAAGKAAWDNWPGQDEGDDYSAYRNFEADYHYAFYQNGDDPPPDDDDDQYPPEDRARMKKQEDTYHGEIARRQAQERADQEALQRRRDSRGKNSPFGYSQYPVDYFAPALAAVGRAAGPAMASGMGGGDGGGMGGDMGGGLLPFGAYSGYAQYDYPEDDLDYDAGPYPGYTYYGHGIGWVPDEEYARADYEEGDDVYAFPYLTDMRLPPPINPPTLPAQQRRPFMGTPGMADTLDGTGMGGFGFGQQPNTGQPGW